MAWLKGVPNPLGLKREDRLFIIPVIVSLFFHFYNLGFSEFVGDEASPLRFTIAFLYGLTDPTFFGSIFLFHHPPLRILINVPTVVMFGTNEFVVRFLSASFGLLSIFLVYKISEEMFNRRTGLLASLLYSVSGISLLNRLSMGIGPFVFFSLLSFLFTIRFFKTRKEAREFSNLRKISFSSALMVLTYLEGIMFLPGILYAIVRKKGWGFLKQGVFWKSIAIFPILIIPFVVPWILIPHLVPGIDPAGSYGYMFHRVDDPSPLNVFSGLGTLLVYNSVYFVALMFTGILASLFFILKNHNLRLLVAYLLPFFFIFTFLIKNPTIHHMHGIPLLMIMGAIGLVLAYDMLDNRAARSMLVFIVLAVLILSASHTLSVLNGEKMDSWGDQVKKGLKAAGCFIRENTETTDYFFSDEDGYVTRIYLGRRYFGDMKTFFDDINKEEWSGVRYILLTKESINTPVWDYVNENYETNAIVYLNSEPSIYIFGREEADEIEILHNEDYEEMFDREYGNMHGVLPYFLDAYS